MFDYVIPNLSAKISQLSPEAAADYEFFRSQGMTEVAAYLHAVSRFEEYKHLIVTNRVLDDSQLSLQLTNQCQCD